MRVAPLVLMLLTVTLGGCLQEDDPGDPALPDEPSETSTGPTMRSAPGPPDGTPRADLPEWMVGDAWTWRFTHAFLEPFEVTTVVTAADASSYRVGATDLEAGLRAQWYHVLPAGVIDRATLGWSAHDQPLALVDFPLVDNKTWTGSMWAADQVSYRASAATVSGPNGPEPGFVVQGDSANGEVVRYEWSTARGMFTWIGLFPGEQFGGYLIELDLLAQSGGTTDAAFVIEPTALPFLFSEMIEPAAPNPSGTQPVQEFDVPADVTHLMIMCVLGGDLGHYAMDFVTPDGQQLGCARPSDQAGETTTHWEQLIPAATPGTYRPVITTIGEGFALAEVLSLRVTEETPPA